MARGINKVILIGNIGADPEVRYMPSGSAVATISVATTEGWKDRETGERQERTEWHRVVLFNRLGEIAGEYLRKGSKVYIEGSLRTRKWQDKSGVERYTTEIVANELQMLDSRGSHSGDNFQAQQNFTQQAAQQGGGHPSNPPPAGHQSAGANQTTTASSAAPSNEFDDDIPF